MTSLPLNLTHAFQSAIPDGPNTALVRPSNWNANHVLTAQGPSLLGVDTVVNGTVSAIQLASDLGGPARTQIPVWHSPSQTMQFRRDFSILGPVKSSAGFGAAASSSWAWFSPTVDDTQIFSIFFGSDGSTIASPMFWRLNGDPTLGQAAFTPVLQVAHTDSTTQTSCVARFVHAVTPTTPAIGDTGTMEFWTSYALASTASVMFSWVLTNASFGTGAAKGTWQVLKNDALFAAWEFDADQLWPTTTNAYSIGKVGNYFKNLYLGASGATINWNNDVVWTYTTDTITATGGSFVAQTSGVIPLHAVRTDDAASVEAFRVRGARATPAINDVVYTGWYLNNSTPTLKELGRMSLRATAVTAGAETSQFLWAVTTGGTLTTTLGLSATVLFPNTASGLTLGTSTFPWGQAFIVATSSPLNVTNSTDGASLAVATWKTARPAGVLNDELYHSFQASNSAGTTIEYARFRIVLGNVTPGAEASNIRFSVMNAGTLTATYLINATAIVPINNGGMDLGSTTNNWGSLWLFDDKKIDWGSGGVTLTHASASDSLTLNLDNANALGSTTFVVSIDGASRLTLTSTTLRPTTDGGLDLGNSATPAGWGNAFFASAKKLDWGNGNATITHASALFTIAGASWKLAAGTTTLGPLQFQSGTNLTTAAAGNCEFDGTCFYATSVASARQIVVTEQLSIASADFTGTDVNTAQPIFTAAQDTFTVAGSTTYEFEAVYWILRSAGTTSHTFATLFGGTATFTGIMYIAHISNPTGTVLGNDQIIIANVATATVLTAANTSATENIYVHLRGSMRINAAGTVIPQFQFSAAPGGAPTIKKDTFFRIWPAGSNTVTQVGNIA